METLVFFALLFMLVTVYSAVANINKLLMAATGLPKVVREVESNNPSILRESWWVESISTTKSYIRATAIEAIGMTGMQVFVLVVAIRMWLTEGQAVPSDTVLLIVTKIFIGLSFLGFAIAPSGKKTAFARKSLLNEERDGKSAVMSKYRTQFWSLSFSFAGQAMAYVIALLFLLWVAEGQWTW